MSVTKRYATAGGVIHGHFASRLSSPGSWRGLTSRGGARPQKRASTHAPGRIGKCTIDRVPRRRKPIDQTLGVQTSEELHCYINISVRSTGHNGRRQVFALNNTERVTTPAESHANPRLRCEPYFVCLDGGPEDDIRLTTTCSANTRPSGVAARRSCVATTRSITAGQRVSSRARGFFGQHSGAARPGRRRCRKVLGVSDAGAGEGAEDHSQNVRPAREAHHRPDRMDRCSSTSMPSRTTAGKRWLPARWARFLQSVATTRPLLGPFCRAMAVF